GHCASHQLIEPIPEICDGNACRNGSGTPRWDMVEYQQTPWVRKGRRTMTVSEPPRRKDRSAPYDAIVVGGRCAGSPTAMLLARRGYRVLVVDRATFPSDTVSSHVLQPTAVAALSRWGLLNQLLATGCPPVHTYAYDFGPVVITGSPGKDQFPSAYCPRRTILDKLLVDAAAQAGAEVREGFAVDEIVF